MTKKKQCCKNCESLRIVSVKYIPVLASPDCIPIRGKPDKYSYAWYQVKWARYQEFLKKKKKPDKEIRHYCTVMPEHIMVEIDHFCGQCVLRDCGYQDIDRTFIEVERVYETRIDCMTMPEEVRRVA